MWPHHVLHADRDLIVCTEGAKEADYVGGVALVKNLQLSHDLVPNCWLYVQHDHLEGKGGGREREGEG